MNVKTHISTSAALSLLLYYFSSSLLMATSAFLSGVLIDLDHFLDFLIFSGEKFSVKNVFSWCNEGRWKKVTLIFHSYEFYAIYGIIVYFQPHPIMVGILFGVGLHLLLDQIGNRHFLKNLTINQLFYFFSFRLLCGFKKEKLGTDKVSEEKE